MNRKQKKELRERQSTRQLMDIDRLTEHGVATSGGELVYFLIRPDNLSVLSDEAIRSRVHSLMQLFGGMDAVRLLALNSRESFQPNKLWYRTLLEREDDPAVRKLLQQDMAHLDTIQTATATAREFAIVCTVNGKGGESAEAQARLVAEGIRNRGFHVKIAGEQDVKRLLEVYYQQDVTTEYFEDYDGERAVSGVGG